VELTVQTGEAYPIYFRHTYEDLSDVLSQADLLGRKICIVTDSNVAPLYLDIVKKALGQPPSFVFEAGEMQKHTNTLQEMYACFLDYKLDRHSVIIALGGGVVGDLAGFAAATFMRGIAFVQLPTSLLAQVDASVGGKTAIDFKGVKNLIGAFYQPRLVYINLTTLETLPRQEFISGMGEVIKHGLIDNSDYYQYLQEHRQAIYNLEPEALLQVVAGSCRIKAAVVAKDERETGLRETLNFGHCVGHAVESLSEYSLPHGQCVSIGMCTALRLSLKMEYITLEEMNLAIKLMKDFDLPIATDYAPEKILTTMYKDKKTINDTLRVVLLKKIGVAYTDSTISNEDILNIQTWSNK